MKPVSYAAVVLGIALLACDDDPPLSDAATDTSVAETSVDAAAPDVETPHDGPSLDQSADGTVVKPDIVKPDVPDLGVSLIGTSLQATATERSNARLVVSTSSALHVVYYDNGIYHVISNDGGTTWAPPLLLTQVGRNPSLAVGPGNKVQLVYKKGGTNAHDIVHRTFDTSWSSEQIAYHNDTILVSRPAVAVGPNGALHCVWMNASAPGSPNAEVYHNSRPSGGSWGATATNISKTLGASEYPTVATDSKGNVYVLWKDSGDDISSDKRVLLRKHTAAQGWAQSYTNVSNTTGNGTAATMEPSVVIDSGDTLHLVWNDSQTGNKQVFYKKCPNGVCPVTFDNVSNSSQPSSQPVISLGAGGKIFVVWNEKTDGVHYDVVLSQRTGSVWSAFTNVSNTAGSDSRFVSAPAWFTTSLPVIWTEGETSPFGVAFKTVF